MNTIHHEPMKFAFVGVHGCVPCNHKPLFQKIFVPSLAAHPSLKTTAMTAAADTCDTAVALTELPAAFVSFRRQQPSVPPPQNVTSAVSPVVPADNSAVVVQFVQQMQHLLHIPH